MGRCPMDLSTVGRLCDGLACRADPQQHVEDKDGSLADEPTTNKLGIVAPRLRLPWP